jgi:hypothetical protein
MALPNIFTKSVTDEITERINKLQPNTQPKWGTMSADQMLAHCNVTYEMIFEDKHKRPNAFMRFILKAMVKNKVVDESTYPQNSRTAPAFIISGKKDFESEKIRLISFIDKVQQLGENHFEGKESLSFGVLNKTEWNNMMYKHLNHHLSQFGV